MAAEGKLKSRNNMTVRSVSTKHYEITKRKSIVRSTYEDYSKPQIISWNHTKWANIFLQFLWLLSSAAALICASGHNPNMFPRREIRMPRTEKNMKFESFLNAVVAWELSPLNDKQITSAVYQETLQLISLISYIRGRVAPRLAGLLSNKYALSARTYQFSWCKTAGATFPSVLRCSSSLIWPRTFFTS